MLREAGTLKVHDWLVNYVVKVNRHLDELRRAWLADPGPGGRECRLGTHRRTRSEEA